MRCLQESGAALLLTFIALALLSLLGLFVTLNSNTGVKISDNYESQMHATYAALAGLHHALALVRGLPFDDLLKGPDGSCNISTQYFAQAKSFEFRNPIPLSAARSLNASFPLLDLSGLSDDGLISTGFYGGSAGTALIPMTGLALMTPDPYGPGEVVTSRYFVKITDNNGESSEISGDLLDDPFLDGDGIVIARSVGIAKTFSMTAGTIPRFNSAAVFEARFKRLGAFDLGPPLVVMGDSVIVSFGGAFQISGGQSPGIGTIDTDRSNGNHPDQIIRTAAGLIGTIEGGGLPNPSVRDISGEIGQSRDRSLLLDPRFLWKFVYSEAPRFADAYFDGDQSWVDRDGPYAGAYDPAKPWNAPEQDPRVTVVHGNLNLSGNFSGGGLLIVTGRLSCAGPYRYDGLVLVLGSGKLAAAGLGPGINGGLLVAGLSENGGVIGFSQPTISVTGNSRFTADRNAVKSAVNLIPVSQISFREIAGTDP
jgi:hypothetical protein